LYLTYSAVVSRPCPGGEHIIGAVLCVRAQLELWLRTGCERLPADNNSSYTVYKYGVYCELVTIYKEGENSGGR